MRHNRNSSHPAHGPDDGLPRSVDKGWAWVVCLGCHVSQMMVLGYFVSLGVFFLEWKKYFDSTATASSWLVSVPWLASASASAIVGVIAPRLDVRPLSMVGAVLNALGTLLGALSKEMWHLYLTSALSGVGGGIVLTSSFVVLIRYFKKRYAFANGIALVGVNVGQVIFPPLMRLFVAHYGWRGAMIIIGALQMNAAAACAFFRPLGTNSKSHSATIATVSETVAMNVVPDRGNTAFVMVTETPQDCPKPTNGLKGLVFPRPLANVRFALVIASFLLYAMGSVSALTHFPARAEEAGWSKDQGAVLLTINAVIAIIARSTHGWVIDRKYIGVFQLHLTMLLSAAVATFFSPVSNSYVFLAGYMVLNGLWFGISLPLFVVVVRKLVGEAGSASAVSWMVILLSFASGTGSVIAGKLFDATGDYVATYLCIGALFTASLLFVGAAAVLEKRRTLSLE